MASQGLEIFFKLDKFSSYTEPPYREFTLNNNHIHYCIMLFPEFSIYMMSKIIKSLDLVSPQHTHSNIVLCFTYLVCIIIHYLYYLKKIKTKFKKNQCKCLLSLESFLYNVKVSVKKYPYLCKIQIKQKMLR